MKKSIATVCLSGDLGQKITAASQAGFDGIEIFENDLLLFHESPTVVRKMAEDAGLKIIALQPFRDFEGMPDAKRAQNFMRAEKKFDVMEQLGTDKLLICSNVSPHAINDKNRCAEDLNHLAERAAKRGFQIGYEALAWGRYIKDYQDAWELVQLADHSHLGIILDSFHIFARGQDLSLISSMPGNKITLVQVADAPYLNMDVLQWSRHYRCFPGQGDFNNIDLIKAIQSTGYDGYLSHEIFNDEFRGAPCGANALDGVRSLLWLQDQVHRHAPELPLLFSHEPPLPPEPSIKEIAFIEFATDSEGSSELLSLLHSLGFRKTHKHKRKEVDLYRLGDVNIVVNQEPDSFAQSYNLIRGVSVCALAYLCDDAKGMLARAKYYGFNTFATNQEAGELSLPAIQGVGEKLIYFMQQQKDGKAFYDIDFEALDDDANEQVSNVRFSIDHVAEGVSVNEFLSNSLYLKSLFGFDITQPQDLIDPYGIVVSRSATSHDKKIRLPFNMTRSAGTATQQFMQANKGAGVQHIALSCDDIIQVAKQAPKALMLPIPDNYYADLEARLSLDEGFLADLRALNLLYDENDTGYFIHFYTREVNGVFFEVVQREQYAGYGEINAHIRMAAQARLRKQKALKN